VKIAVGIFTLYRPDKKLYFSPTFSKTFLSNIKSYHNYRVYCVSRKGSYFRLSRSLWYL